MSELFYGWRQEDKANIHAIIAAWSIEILKTYPHGMTPNDIQVFAGKIKKPQNDKSWTPEKSVRVAKYIRDHVWPDIEVLDEEDFTDEGVANREYFVQKQLFDEKKAENAFLEARNKQNKADLKLLQKKVLKIRLEEKLEERLRK